MESPCKECEDRTVTPNCHDHCIAYKRWQAERHKAFERKREFMIQLHDVQVSDAAHYGRRRTVDGRY